MGKLVINSELLNTHLDAFRSFLAAYRMPAEEISIYVAAVYAFLSEVTLSQDLSLEETAQLPGISAEASEELTTEQAKQAWSLWKEFVSSSGPRQGVVSNISSLSAEELAARFEVALEGSGRSPNTVKNYAADLRSFLQFFENPKSVDFLTKPNLLKYLESLKGEVSDSTLERKTTALRQFCTWAKQKGFIVTNPLELEGLTPSPVPRQAKSPISRRFHFALAPSLSAIIAVLLISLLSFGAYTQFIVNVSLSKAFPTALTRPNRILSFQARLSNTNGSPITSSSGLDFRLYDASSGGTNLWSGSCTVTPDSNGIFSVLLGDTCGAEIDSSVFSENAQVWLEVQVGSETLSPRQRIASVAYALNAETLQGYPPATPAQINTIPVVDNSGAIVIGAASPTLQSINGTFAVKANALVISTNTGTGGNITLAPDGNGQVQVLSGTTSTDSLHISNANLTTGSLISGTVGNNNTGYKFISLAGGSSPTEKFSVSATGNVVATGTFTGRGAILTATTGTDVPLQVNGTGGNVLSVTNSGDITLAMGANIKPNTDSTTALNIANASGTRYVTFDSSNQRVGIGTSSPGTALDVNGAITSSSLNTAGGIIYATNSSGTLGVSVQGTNGQCLVSGGAGAPTWGTCGSGGGSGSNWRIVNGALSPNNDTLDVLIGSSATASAKFGFINVNSGTPTFLINGSSVLSQTTLGSSVVNSSLTSVGNLSSGSIVSGFGTIDTTNTITGTTLNGTTGINTGAGAGTQRIDASGNLVNINNITAGGTIDFTGLGTGVVQSTGGVLSIAQVDLTSEVTGILPIANGGTNTSTLGAAGTIAYSNGTNYAFSSVGSNGQCLVSGGAGTPTWTSCSSASSNFWQLNGEVLSPINSTWDLAIGGTSTASAKFLIEGLTGNATTSGNLTFAGTAATNVIAARNNAGLILGDSQTGNVVMGAPLDLFSGTTTQPALRFATGVNLTSPLSGAVEFDGSRLYLTDSTPTRHTIAFNPMTTLGDIIYGGVGGVETRLAGNITTTQKFLSQTGNGASSNAPSWQTIPTQGTLTYYFQDTASDVATYKKMLITPYTPKTTLSTPGLAPGNTVLQNWVTDPGIPNLSFIPAGQFEFHVHAAQTAGTQTSQVYAEFWEVNATGADIAKIGTSEVSTALTGSEAEYRLFFTTSTVYTMNSTASRIVARVFSTVSGIGTAPTVALYYGDEADSHITLPSATVDSSNFVPYIGATQNVILGNHSLFVGSSNQFSVNNVGNVLTSGNITSSTLNTPGGIIYAQTGGLLAVSADGIVGQCLVSGGTGTPTWTSCSSAASNFWQNDGTTVAPANTTWNLAIGGTSTASAKFLIEGLTGNATTSGTFTFGGTAATNVIAARDNAGLTIGDSQTGNINFNTNGTVNFSTLINANAGLTIASGQNLTLTGFNSCTGLTTTSGGVVTCNTNAFANINFWQLNGEVLSPANSNYDLAVGGTSTGSAKFQVFAATGNATTSGNLTFAGTSATNVISAQNMAGLTIGDANTGNIILNPNGNVGIKNLNPTQALDVTGNILASGTITGTTINGTTGINTGAGAGTQRIDATGNLVNIGTITASGLISANGGLTIASGQNLTLTGFNSCTGLTTTAGGVVTCNTNAFANINFWQLNGEVLSPANSNFDVAVGGTATSSAKFQIFAATGNATTSGNLTFAGTSGTNVIAAQNMAGLTLGDANTGNIILNPNGNIGIKNTNPTATLDVTGTIQASSLNTPGGVIYAQTNGLLAVTAAGTLNQCLISNGAGTPTWGSCTTGATNFWQIDPTGTVISPSNSTWDVAIGGTATSSAKFQVFGLSGNTFIGGYATVAASLAVGYPSVLPGVGNAAFSGSVGIGTDNPTATLQVVGSLTQSGGNVSINDNSGANTVSLGSGTTNGTVTIGNGPSNQIVAIANGAGNKTLDLGSTFGTSGTFILSGNNGVNINDGNNQPTNINTTTSTGQVTIGGSGTQTIIIGNGAGGTNPKTVTLGSINTTSTTTINGGSNGILMNPGNFLSGVSIGTSNVEAPLYISSGYGANAAFIVDQLNSGDIFAASASGVTKMVLSNAGNLGIGTATPTEKLDVQGNATVSGNITIGAGSALQSANGPLTLNYKSGPNSWAPSVTIQSDTGFVGILNTNPTQALDVTGNILASGTITGTTLNGTTGINTGAGAGTQRIDASGNLVNIGTITAAGLIQANGGITIASGQNLTLTGFNSCTGLTTNGSGVVQCNTNAFANVNFWQLNGEVLSPANSNYDLAVGGTATSSAKFQVFAATGDATMAGILTVNTIRPADGPLILDYKSGPNSWLPGIILQPNTGNVGIGATNPLARLDIAGSTSTITNTVGDITISPASGLVSLNGSNLGNFAQTWGTIGAVGAPTYSFAGDTNTGMYSGGADYLRLVTGGVDRLVIDPNGLVGIGTSAPTALLQVNGGYANNAAFIVNQLGSGDLMAASASGTTRFRIDNSGNVLASSFQDIQNTSYFLDPANVGTSLTVAGNVGIGTTTPVSLLNVTGATAGKSQVIFNETGDQNILTASSSGTAVFQISHNGDVTIGSASLPDVAVNLYGDVLQKENVSLSGITGVTSTFVYDTSKDSDFGAWTDNLYARASSWYNEAKGDSVSVACSISTMTRCGASAFPRKAVIVADASNVYIFDAVSNKMWMKFTQASVTGALGADSNNNPSSIQALNGIVYIGLNGSSGIGVVQIDFKNDRMYLINSTNRSQGDKTIANRNTTVTYNVAANTNLLLVNSIVNDLHVNVINGKTYLLTALGANTLADNSEGYTLLNFSDNKSTNFLLDSQTTDDIRPKRVWLTSTGNAYLTYFDNTVTADGIDIYYNIQTLASEGSIGASVAAGFFSNNPNQLLPNTVESAQALWVTEGTSNTDGKSDSIYFGGAGGMTTIQYDTLTPSYSIFKYYTKDYISEELGKPLGFWPLSDGNNALSLLNVTGATGLTLTNNGGVTAVPGVRGMAANFVSASSQSLSCTDANCGGSGKTDWMGNVFGVGAWIKTTQTASADILSKGTTADFSWQLKINNNVANKVDFILNTAAGAQYGVATSTTSINDGQWHFIVGAFGCSEYGCGPSVSARNVIRIYVDGVQEASNSTLSGTPDQNSAADFVIGGRADHAAGTFFNGQIDEPFVTNLEFTPELMMSMYLDGRKALQHQSIAPLTASSGTTNSITNTLQSWTPQQYVGSLVQITGGTGSGQTRQIASNSGQLLTVSPNWTTTPDTTSTFIIKPQTLYGASNIISAITVSDEPETKNRFLYVGTKSGTGTGGVTKLDLGGDTAVDAYHNDAGKVDEAGNAWSSTSGNDDITALSSGSKVLSIGSSSLYWQERSELTMMSELDKLNAQVSGLTKQIININQATDMHYNNNGTHYTSPWQVVRKGWGATGLTDGVTPFVFTGNFGITYDDVPIVVSQDSGVAGAPPANTTLCGAASAPPRYTQYSQTTSSFNAYLTGSGAGGFSAGYYCISWIAIGSYRVGFQGGDGLVNSSSYPWAAGADLAEWYPTNDPTLQAGEVVSVASTGEAKVERATKATATSALGIISTKPATILGDQSGLTPGYKEDEFKPGTSSVAVALAGRVPVKVSLENGIIHAGDYLAPGTIPGYVAKAITAGPVVGKALENFDGKTTISNLVTAEATESATFTAPDKTDPAMIELNEGRGTILAFIQNGYWDPDTGYSAGQIASNYNIEKTATDSGALSGLAYQLRNTVVGQLIDKALTATNALIANLTAGSIHTEELASKTIATNTLKITDQFQNPVASFDEAGNATFSGTLTAKQGFFGGLTLNDASISGTLYAENIAGLREKVASMVADQLSTASALPTSGIAFNYESSPSADFIASITDSNAEVLARIAALEAKTNDASTSGLLASSVIPEELSIGHTLLLDSTGLSSAADVLNIQGSGHGQINFLAGVMTLDSTGLVVNTDTYFARSVTIKEDLMVDVIRGTNGGISLHLATPSSEMSDRVAIFNGQNEEAASIDASGSARFNKLIIASALQDPNATATFSGQYRTNASTGESVLPAGTRALKIVSPKISNDSLIYVTPTSSTANQVLYVSRKYVSDPTLPGNQSYFVVSLDNPLAIPVAFNWWVIN